MRVPVWGGHAKPRICGPGPSTVLDTVPGAGVQAAWAGDLPACKAIARCIALRARGVSRASW